MKLFNTYILWISLLLAGVFLNSCKEEEPEGVVFGAAFETAALGIGDTEDQVEVTLSFTKATTVENQITFSIEEAGVIYGTDYETDPEAVDGELTLTVPAGADSASFTVTRLADFIGPGRTVTFTILSVEGEQDPSISGNTSVTLSFEAITSVGGTLLADLGGPAEPNQVFIDLSQNHQTSVARTSWDLGFFTGDEDRVILNYSTYMAAMALEKTSMEEVSVVDTAGLSATLAVGAFGSDAFVDQPGGDLDMTVFGELSATEAESPVYLINLGVGPGTGTVDPGAVDVSSSVRGWKKVQILLSGEGYIVRYADLNATNYEEVTISKDDAHSFVHFSFGQGNTVVVEPLPAQWDLQLTVATGLIPGYGAYGYSDFARINGRGGVEAVMIATMEDDGAGTLVETGARNYESFSGADIEGLEFSSVNDAIGATWRSVFTLTAFDYRYFILRDTEGNYYKLQFLGLVDNEGVRGHISLKYELL